MYDQDGNVAGLFHFLYFHFLLVVKKGTGIGLLEPGGFLNRKYRPPLFYFILLSV